MNETTKVPGPGEYKLYETNPLGKFPFSNVKNTTNIIWGSSKERRFNYSCKKRFNFIFIENRYILYYNI